MDVPSPQTRTSNGHSADVQIYLHFEHLTIRLAQAGPHSVKPADESERVPAGAGTLEIVVDGNSYKRSVAVSAAEPGAWAAIS